MARFSSLVVVAGTLVACGSSTASSVAPSHMTASHCGPAAKTLAANSQSRVYQQGDVVLGCTTGSARQVRLGSTARCIKAKRVEAVAVGGRMAAVALQRCQVDTSSTEVAVLSLVTGRQLYSHAAGGVAGPESFTTVTAIVVRSDGVAAWITRSTSIVSHRTQIAVLARKGHGVRTLAAGAAINPGVLKLSGGRVSWREGSSTKSARLG